MNEKNIIDTEDTLERNAAYWTVRLSSSTCGPADRAAFEAWRNEDPSHAEAFERTEKTLAFVDRHIEHPSIGSLIDDVMLETAPKSRLFQSWGIGIAATICAAVMSVIVLMQFVSPQSTDNSEVYGTAVGERRTITLSDGSTVTLNTNSRIEVAYNSARRDIQLIQGQALFEVAKNASWPFVVEAGNQRITALGTAFDVRVDDKSHEEIQVALVEGRVAVDEFNVDNEGHEQPVIPENRIELIAGERLIASANQRIRAVEKIDLEEVTGWREGRIVFRNTPLKEAVKEVNRYTKQKLQLADDVRLHNIRISGVFNTGRIAPFVSALQITNPVVVWTSTKSKMVLSWEGQS